jgi:XTP/dITP diphosphohydrolase
MEMKRLIFATHNLNKIREIQHLIGERFTILSLDDIGYTADIPENKENIEGNAMEKATKIYELFYTDCFADDTGLEVEILNGQPGVISARFADYTGERNPGEDISDANIRKLLRLMKGQTNRQARFRTVIALILHGKRFLFEGIVSGHILEMKRGENGFGYDPVFQPEGHNQTFAEMTLDQKNGISHRAIAIKRLSEFLLEGKGDITK